MVTVKSELRTESDPGKKALLFIDDDPVVVSSLQHIFNSGYETFSASTGQDGIRLFSKVHPQVVILDLRLPDISGIETLRAIRTLDSDAAVIILTGYSTSAAAEESLRLGAVDYMHKPFDIVYLKKRIDKILQALESGESKQALEKALNESLQRLHELHSVKNASSAFLHDISSPLTGIMTAAEILNEKLKQPETISKHDLQQLVSTILENSQYTRALVEQWRAFSEPQTLKLEQFQVGQVLELAMGLTRDRAKDCGVELDFQTQNPDAIVRGNRFAIARVLANLLTNAIEASPAGSGKVVLISAAHKDSFHFIVSDNGDGIAEDQLDVIFQPRYTTKKKGMGLGLYISKKIIEAAGGKIVAHPCSASSGAEFIVSLPLAS